MSYSNKTVTVLGSTGSVGTQALDIVRDIKCRVKLLSAGSNIDLLVKQAIEFEPEYCHIADLSLEEKLREALSKYSINVISGEEALAEVLLSDHADVTVQAIAGLRALHSTFAAASTPTRLAMANKEAIISAGELIFDRMKQSGGELIPVDSEHSAIFQCLRSGRSGLRRLILTASGGPFYGRRLSELSGITPREALAHPTWKMGAKITVDSATMMNKGFEIIEAAKLFGVDSSMIDVVVHRESIIHSMVEYTDNAVIAQLGMPDMRECVRYAISYPERSESHGERLDLCRLGSLTFKPADDVNFPLLRLAREALVMGGAAPIALIAADEAAVDAFLSYKLGFTEIAEVVSEVLSGYGGEIIGAEEDVFACARKYRRAAEAVIEQRILKGGK